MPPPYAIAAVVAAAGGMVLAGYWLLVITEGAPLGPTVVTFLYDKSAGGYDELKDVPAGWDEERIVRPLFDALGSAPRRVLDLATGTGRGLVMLLSDPEFEGEAVGIDASAGMLEEAWRKVGGWTPRAQLVHASVAQAPFLDNSFDAVLMLEALEFVPRPRRMAAELARLVRPGGVVVLTNRIGWEARLMPGRAFTEVDLRAQLVSAGFTDVRFERWQTHYALVWARRPGSADVSGAWLDVASCPRCGEALRGASERLECGRGHYVEWSRGAWQFVAAGRGRSSA